MKKFLRQKSMWVYISGAKAKLIDTKWIIDSDAINLMSHHLPSFVLLSPNSSMSIASANGDSFPLSGIGTITTPFLSLANVYRNIPVGYY